MAESRAVIFDMDDTLYLERDYVRSGFRAVASSSPNPDGIYQQLWSWFEAGVRGDTFNRILAEEPEWAADVTVADLVAVYRNHSPSIRMLPEAAKLVDELRRARISTGVLTDGPSISQHLKVEALGLANSTDFILLTDTLGRAHWKPSDKGFEWMEQRLSMTGDRLVYIGDNPTKDFIAPRRRGWRTIRLRLAGQLRESINSPNSMAEAEFEFTTWDEVSAWVRAWAGLNT